MKLLFSGLFFWVSAVTIAFAQAPPTVISQIHNACGWEPNASYTYSAGPPTAPFTRVNNGPGWTPSGSSSCGPGTYTNGQALNNYQLISPGTCTSASSGGPSGTGSDIVDGVGGTACHWKYVSGVDYVTLTGWTLDNGNLWASGTVYGFYDIVATNAAGTSQYIQIGGGCISIVQPAGTASDLQTADGCEWRYNGSITYTSRVGTMPTQTFANFVVSNACIGADSSCTSAGTNLYIPVVADCRAFTANSQYVGGAGVYSKGAAQIFTKLTAVQSCVNGGSGVFTVSYSQQAGAESMVVSTFSRAYGHIQSLYGAEIWNDQEYVCGVNNENNPIELQNHINRHNDSIQYVPAPPFTSAPNGTPGWPFDIFAAPGESFSVTYQNNPALALSEYNANYGVAIKCNATANFGALAIGDNNVWVEGIQFTSNTTDGTIDGQYVGRACNVCFFDHDLIQNTYVGVQAAPVVGVGAATFLWDDVVITSSLVGIQFDYAGYLIDSTIIGTGGQSNSVGVSVGNQQYGCNYFYGNAIYGFAHAFARNSHFPVASSCNHRAGEYTYGGNNYTDAPIGDGGTGLWMGGGTTTVTTLPGATYGKTAAASFVTWPGNYKITQSSPLYKGGASFNGLTFPFPGGFCFGPMPGNYSGSTLPSISGYPCYPDSPDIAGTARPQGTRYDAGAYELPGGGNGGGRLLLR